MSKLNLRGVIVPSEYDASWAAGYIDKGIIIPESRFRAELDKANKGEPLTVYINSPGGSVFAAGEMVNAVREWKAETKQSVEVVLGALTASAASMFAIMVADKIKAHANAKMMFHGAWTMSIGGKEMHEDTADLLEKINGDIKTRLVSKYGMAPELIAEWFAEGREGWLSAQELVESKLASEIIEDPSDVIDFPTEALGEIEARGLGIAAFLDAQKTEGENQDDSGEANKQPGASDGDQGSEPGANDGADNGLPSADYLAGVAAGTAQTAAELAERINGLEEQLRKMQSDRDKARAEITAAKTDHAAQLKKIDGDHTAIVADMKTRLATAQEKCERLVSGGMKFSPEKADDGKRTAADVDPRNRLHPSLR